MAKLALIFLAAGARERSNRDEFALGVEAYARAREASDPQEARKLLEGSRDHFQRIVASGLENGYVHYNLGNAHFKLGELGKAVAAYRRAERFIPDLSDLKANLELARSKRPDDLPLKQPNPALRALLFWHYAVGLDAMEKAAALLWVVGFAVLGASLRWPRARIAGVAVLGLSLFAVASSAVKLRSESRREGVVTAPEARVMSEPSGSSEMRFTLHEGAEVRVERESETRKWLLISAGEGLRGWMEARHLEGLSPGAPSPATRLPEPQAPSPGA